LLYCSTHAKENMIDIKHMKCIIGNCDVTALFNNPGEKIGLYCSKHARKNMIDIRNSIEIA
jgi:hypothetical protein